MLSGMQIPLILTHNIPKIFNFYNNINNLKIWLGHLDSNQDRTVQSRVFCR